MLHRKKCGWGALIVSVLALPAFAQMTLPGKFEVTDTGSASYTIPISVAPGAAGLEPKLSLQYDSRSGNGLLGVGWSLSGLPAITRCGKTIAQDGAVGGVAFDANDRFCLDGQRLIATAGTYGADQAEYRTERESFSKVVSYGTAGSGPAWFKVWTKAGLVMEFGNTADSRIESQGKSSARVWAISKTSDTKGNYFSVSYSEDNANGEYRPLRIDYTGNGSIAPANSVRFVYETRPDIVPLYQAGSLIKTTQRMTKVQVLDAETPVREYRFTYEMSTETLQSRLIGAVLCIPDNKCLPTTSMAWQNSNLQLPHNGNIAGQDGSYLPPNGWSFTPGDFNGDGLTDILVTHSSGTWNIWLSQGNNTYATVTNFGGNNGYYGTASGWKFYLADFNGDGRTDILVSCDDGRREIWLSQGDTAATLNISRWGNIAGQNGTHLPPSGWNFTPADFNGDGYADILITNSSSAVWNIWLNQKDGTFAIVSNLGGNNGNYGAANGWTFSLADFNGDGRTDFLLSSNDNRREIWLTQGDAAATLTMTRISNVHGHDGYYQPLNGWRFTPADFNGDGLADILITHTSGAWNIWLNHGDGSFNGIINFGGNEGYYGTGSDWSFAIGDFNGDGRADILVSHSSGRWEVWRTDGSATAGLTVSRITGIQSRDGYYGSASGWTYMLGDFNGDGRTDVLVSCVDGRREIWMGQSVVQDGLINVRVGMDTSTEVAYGRLSGGGALYARDAGAVSPQVDVQGAFAVVSEVKSSNGVSTAPYRSTYRYAGAKADQHGRGFLGFRQMTVRDEQTGVEQVTSYRQDYPFTGLVASREKKLGALVLNRSTNTYGATDLGGTRRYPFLTQSLEESWELTGAALPAVTTGYQYDAFGNATQVSVSTGDGHAKTTVNTYSNDATTWLLGRLTRSEVTSTTPVN